MSKPVDHQLDPHGEAQLRRALAPLKNALSAELAPPPSPLLTARANVRRLKREAESARQRPRFWFVPPVAVSSVLAFCIWAGWWVALPTAAPLASQPFLALPGVDQSSLQDARQVVRTTMPAMAFANAMPLAPEQAAELVKVDVLVSPRGDPLAVRFVND